MTTTIKGRQHLVGTSARQRLAGPAFVLGGIAFFIGGSTHPIDSGEGNKVLQRGSPAPLRTPHAPHERAAAW